MMASGSGSSSSLSFDLGGPYAWQGFDMDHTFVTYQLDATGALIFRGIAAHLHALRPLAYPARLFAGVAHDTAASTKGVVFDAENGHLVHVTTRNTVCCGRHGSTPLDAAALERAYGADRRFPHAAAVRAFERDPRTFAAFSSPFGLPGVQVLAILVDHVDSQAPASEAAETLEAPQRPDYAQLLADVFGAFADMYDPSSLRLCRGAFFPALAAEPGRFLVKTAAAVLDMVRALRASGQKVFLMTNSRLDFAEVVMQFAVGPDWRSRFDLVIGAATKPAFFTAASPGAPFRPEGSDAEEAVVALGGPAVHFGGWRALRDQLGAGAEGSKVLYWGDDLNGDVAALRATGGAWDAVAVVEELGDGEHANSEHVFHCPSSPHVGLVLDQGLNLGGGLAAGAATATPTATATAVTATATATVTGGAGAATTLTLAAVEEEAVLCVPSVLHVAARLAKDSSGLVLHGCKHSSYSASERTLWFPLTPLELLHRTNAFQTTAAAEPPTSQAVL